jgi:hypothetical protein
MPLEDLDLEFEDEEEAKRRKKEAVDVDVDLEFHTPEGVKPRPSPQNSSPSGGVSKPASVGSSPPSPKPMAEVRKIQEARGSSTTTTPTMTQTRPIATSRPLVSGSSALKEDQVLDVDAQLVVDLQEQMKKVEFEAQVKVAVAEFKTDYLTEVMSDVKLVDHQISQLLARINAKHPDVKNEVLMIKKILADFIAKKRK